MPVPPDTSDAQGAPAAMRIAVATRDFGDVSGHAGKARHWLVFDCRPGAGVPEPRRVCLEQEQLFHYFDDSAPHPLDGVELVVAGGAGDGFIRHLAKRGSAVLLTGETDPRAALARILAGEALPDPRFDVTRIACRVRDLFARH